MTRVTSSTAAEIRAWLEATDSVDISTGPAIAEAMQRAETAWRQIRDGDVSAAVELCRPDAIDELHALCRVIALEGESPLGQVPHLLTIYQLVENMAWVDDTMGEKTELLAKFGYLGWLSARRTGAFAEAENWERKTVDAALAQDTVREFLDLPASDRSEELTCRFLDHGAVLLAARAHLKRRGETAPLECLESAISLYSWVSRPRSSFELREEDQYFAAEFALFAAVMSKHCGRYADCDSWLKEVERACAVVLGKEHTQARAAFVRLALMHECHQYEEVLTALPETVARFDRLGMELFSAKATFLEALTLKILRRNEEALLVLGSLERCRALDADLRLRAMTITAIAEIEGRFRRFDAAYTRIATAKDLLSNSGDSIAVAYLHGVQGELLRDQGRFDEAAGEYRVAIAINSAGGFYSQVAYLRVVLAEMLLAAGKEREATAEIVLALPLIEEHELVREGIAAVGLLRESIRRKKADSGALK